jgi:hypothetical protein
MPTAYQAGVNSSLRHYFKAVAATRSVDPETMIAQMRKTPVDDFFAHGGKVREERPHGARHVSDADQEAGRVEAEMRSLRISRNRCRRRCVSPDRRGWRPYLADRLSGAEVLLLHKLH